MAVKMVAIILALKDGDDAGADMGACAADSSSHVLALPTMFPRK